MPRKASFAAVFFLMLAVASLWPASAQAQYPQRYYGGAYGFDGSVRVMVTPREAEVYVDGYYAGIVDDFDGLFQRLHVPPGDHEITLYREGYRTVHQKVYLTPDSTYKLRHKMEKLAPGDIAEPRPVAAAPPAGEPYPPQAAPPQMPRGPRTGPQGMPPRRMPPQPMPPPPGGPAAEPSSFGTLSIRVQPPGAEILIDGERWRGPVGADERLIVQLAEGTHRVEVQKDGFRTFSTEVHIRRSETAQLNVSLPPD